MDAIGLLFMANSCNQILLYVYIPNNDYAAKYYAISGVNHDLDIVC